MEQIETVGLVSDPENLSAAAPVEVPPERPKRSPVGVRPLGPNRWQVRATRTNHQTGRRLNRRARVTGTLADALIARDRLRDELSVVATPRPRPGIRLRDYAAQWMRDRAPLLKPSTVLRYRLSLESHVLPALGDFLVANLLPSDVRQYVARRMESGAAGYSVLNELRVLRTIARDAVADRHVPTSFTDRVRPPTVSHWSIDRPNLLTADEFRRVFAKVPRGWRGLVAVLASTGLRWGEATGLRWGDIRIVDGCGEATIRRANWKGRSLPPKTLGSVRTVPIVPEVLAWLGPPGAEHDLVFPTRRGTPHRGSPLRKVLDAACTAAGVRRITAHGLRRTFNNLARQRADRVVVKELMGHTTDAMLAHYSVVDGAEKRTAATAVADSLGLIRRPPTPAPPVPGDALESPEN